MRVSVIYPNISLRRSFLPKGWDDRFGLLIKIASALFLNLFVLNLVGCGTNSPSQAPVFDIPEASGATAAPPQMQRTAFITNVRPDGRVVLIDGINQTFSADIDLRVSTPGKEEFDIFFATPDLARGPAMLAFNNNGGEAHVHETLSWTARSHGKFQVVTVSVYKKESINFIGLDAVQNRYSVACNPNEFFLSLWIKKVLQYCADVF